MAGSKTSTLVVRVISDASQAQRELADTASRIEGFQKKVVAAAVGMFAADKIMAGVKAVVTAASDLEQSMGGVDAVFKSSAQQVHAWAKDTADSVRIPAAAYEQLATIIGAQLKNAGVSMQDLAPRTRDLLELGADLAAQFGTDIPQAINAVSSALKGEMDPIERYGVTLSDSAVQAKKAELGLTGLSGAADIAATSQARLAVIFEQTADAQGAAARESDTYQAKLDSLHEKVTNAAAEVGGPLLTAFGSLADRASDLIPIFQPIAQGIANVVQAVATLPAPVLVAVAGLAAFALVAPGIIKLLAAMPGAITAVRAAWVALSATVTAHPLVLLATAAAIVVLTIALKEWADAQADAATASAKFTSNVADYQQIIHKAVMGVTTGAESGMELRLAAYDHIDDAWKGLVKTGETVGSTFKSVGTDVGTALDGLMGNSRQATKVVDAFNSKIADLERQRDAFVSTPMTDIWKFWESGSKTAGDLNPSIQENIDLLTKQRDKYEALVPEIAQARLEEDARNGSMGEAAQAAQLEIDAQRELEAAMKAASEELSKQQGHFKILAAQTEGAQILDQVSTSAAEATRAIAIYQAEVDKATGNNRSYQASQAAFNQTILDIPKAFKQASEGAGFNREAFKAWDTQLLTTSEGGQQVYHTIQSMADASNDATVRAYENAKATHTQAEAIGIAGEQADNSYNQFVGMAESMGLSTDEAVALAGKLGLVNKETIDDKIFQVIAEDQKAQQTMKLWEAVVLDPKTQRYVALTPSAAELAAQMNAIIDGTKPNPIETPAEVTGAAEAGAAAGADASAAAQGAATATQIPAQPTGGAEAGATASAQAQGAAAANPAEITVTAPAIPDISAGLADIAHSSVTVIITADTTQAWSAVQLFKQASVVPATVQIKGDVTQANASIRAVISGIYSTTVQVKGDNNDAIRAVRAVTTGTYETTVRIQGDNSGAIAAVRSITTGSYQATVHISGDASAFYSVWNSLPTTKSITVTVNQVQGSVVPSAAPPSTGRLSAAPTVSARGLTTQSAAPAGGGSTINITVQGALDPDAVARQIKRLIVDRDRRSGGVVVGAMRARIGSQ